MGLWGNDPESTPMHGPGDLTLSDLGDLERDVSYTNLVNGDIVIKMFCDECTQYTGGYAIDAGGGYGTGWGEKDPGSKGGSAGTGLHIGSDLIQWFSPVWRTYKPDTDPGKI